MKQGYGISLAVFVGLTADVFAQSPGDIALEREKIGAIAKVTLSVEAPESPQILRGGLNDVSARVRAAAARVGHAIGARGLVPELRNALAKETDPEAARELAWGIAELETTDASNEVLVIAAKKAEIGGVVRRAVALGSRGIEGREALLLAAAAEAALAADGEMEMRTPEGYPPGFVDSALVATGCEGKPDAFEMADIEFRPGGRPKSVSVFRSAPTSPPCNKALQILAYSALSEGEKGVRLILPDQPEFLACTTSAGEKPPTPTTTLPHGEKAMRITGGIKEPKKIKNRPPRYPDSAKDSRSQGIVIMEATISTSGCVRSIRRLKGVTPALDVSAMTAVAAWVYTPTLLYDAPVPVIMTVTVSFRLN